MDVENVHSSHFRAWERAATGPLAHDEDTNAEVLRTVLAAAP